ncbi:ribosomal protein S18-alanine N-acetyltransferase [Rhodobacter sp. 24-YEA-8]|uniref:ribosomal protein S18-alanine N-acetyltransferase n=1 Tax=Rhodobacter sp. 24-YEA-8 TaxID=1884310 RepID=UPI00209AEEA0|nr:ribosomal protein S18-alanine N-acetyltransferase [Rhodobacter sp. 24-YEA-8]
MPAALAECLARIHAASFTMPRPWSAAEIAGLLSRPHVFLLTEAREQEPAGFLIGSAIAGEAELLTLAVHPRHRRQGLGECLVARFLAEAGARNASSQFLEVAADNAPAIALYTRVGFHEAGRRRNYYHGPRGNHVDALVLARGADACHQARAR